MLSEIASEKMKLRLEEAFSSFMAGLPPTIEGTRGKGGEAGGGRLGLPTSLKGFLLRPPKSQGFMMRSVHCGTRRMACTVHRLQAGTGLGRRAGFADFASQSGSSRGDFKGRTPS